MIVTHKERKPNSRFKPIIAALIICLLAAGWHYNFFGMLDKVRDVNPILGFFLGPSDRPAEIPDDAIFIRQYGGVDPDSASQDEIEEGMNKGEQELYQAIQDMESEFYIDSKYMLMDYEQIPIEAFWVDTWVMEEWKNSLGDACYRVEMKYNCTAEERIAMQNEIDQAVAEYVSATESAHDNWEKELIIHDKLVTDITYDQSKERTHRGTIYGALVEGEAVCEGYARAYTYLLDRAGVQGSYIATTWKSEDDNDPGHAWNSVPSTSNSCLVDVTWDDPDKFDAYGNPYILHDYFLIAPEEAERLDDHQHPYPSSDSTDSVESNYHQVEGWYQTSYDPDQLTAIFANQIDRDKNLLTVKYSDEETFGQAANSLLGYNWEDPNGWDGSRLFTIIAAAGGNNYDNLSVSINEELYIINVYLNPQTT